MSEAGENAIKFYWEKYCPCRLHRKNVVLMTLTIACFALVTWTLIATSGEPEDDEDEEKANATDTKVSEIH